MQELKNKMVNLDNICIWHKTHMKDKEHINKIECENCNGIKEDCKKYYPHYELKIKNGI